MDNLQHTIEELALNLFHAAGISCSVSVEVFDRGDMGVGYAISVMSDENLGYIAGRQGSHIGSIEHLLRVMLARRVRNSGTPPYISLDINRVRKAQSDNLARLARAAAERVQQTGIAEAMVCMDSYERRIIHNELASCLYVETESVGVEPRRRVMVKPVVS